LRHLYLAEERTFLVAAFQRTSLQPGFLRRKEVAFMSSSNSSIWDESAGVYAELAPNISFYQQSSEKIVSAARLEPGMNVLDLGCGSAGLAVIKMLQQVPALNMIFAVDASPKMVEVATQHIYAEADRFGVEARKVRFITSPAERIDRWLPLNGINRIVCNSAFWMFQTEAALESIKQVLAPEESLFVFNLAEWDYIFDDAPVLRHPRYEVIDRELERLHLPAKPSRGSEHKFSREELEALFSESGFTLQKTQEFVVATSWRDWALFYQIPTIIRKSLPQIPYPTARKVLEAAMKNLEGRDLPGIRWVTFTAVPTAASPRRDLVGTGASTARR
jgi:ubiquinone/menaquinone biosynthesis C-methylase UbiE